MVSVVNQARNQLTQSAIDSRKQCFSLSACIGLSRDTASVREFACSRCRRIKLLF